MIDFYDAKNYINEKLKINIEDSLIEKFLKDKGYKNIVKRKELYHDESEFSGQDNESETEEIDISSEEVELEDFDIDDIVNMEFTPNTNSAVSVKVGNSWIRHNERNKFYNYSDNTALIKEYKRTRSNEALSFIVELNLKLVIKYAMGYSKLLSGNGLTVEDLIQEGSIGLIKAIEKFDVNKGYEFSTYASWWIRQAIHRAISDKDSIIRLPVHMIDNLIKMKKLELEHIRLYGEVVSEEICNSLKVSMEKYIEYKRYEYQYGSMASLDKAVGEDEDSELINFVGEKNVGSLFGNYKEYGDPELLYEEVELSKVVAEVLSTLKEKESTIIKYRFGLIDGRTHTLEEIGKFYNVTRERIRQIEAKAIKKLRHPSRSGQLKPFTGQYISVKPNKIETQTLLRINAVKEKQVKNKNIEEKKINKKNEALKATEDAASKLVNRYLNKSQDIKAPVQLISMLGEKQQEAKKKFDLGKFKGEKLIGFLKKQDLKIIDNRSKGGRMWIIGGEELSSLFEDLSRRGMNFKYVEKGSKVTGYKHAWFYK